MLSKYHTVELQRQGRFQLSRLVLNWWSSSIGRRFTEVHSGRKNERPSWGAACLHDVSGG